MRRSDNDNVFAVDESGNVVAGALAEALAKHRSLRLQFLHCGGFIAEPSISRKVICTRTPFHRGAPFCA